MAKFFRKRFKKFGKFKRQFKSYATGNLNKKYLNRWYLNKPITFDSLNDLLSTVSTINDYGSLISEMKVKDSEEFKNYDKFFEHIQTLKALKANADKKKGDFIPLVPYNKDNIPMIGDDGKSPMQTGLALLGQVNTKLDVHIFQHKWNKLAMDARYVDIPKANFLVDKIKLRLWTVSPMIVLHTCESPKLSWFLSVWANFMTTSAMLSLIHKLGTMLDVFQSIKMRISLDKQSLPGAVRAPGDSVWENLVHTLERIFAVDRVVNRAGNDFVGLPNLDSLGNDLGKPADRTDAEWEYEKTLRHIINTSPFHEYFEAYDGIHAMHTLAMELLAFLQSPLLSSGASLTFNLEHKLALLRHNFKLFLKQHFAEATWYEYGSVKLVHKRLNKEGKSTHAFDMLFSTDVTMKSIDNADNYWHAFSLATTYVLPNKILDSHYKSMVGNYQRIVGGPRLMPYISRHRHYFTKRKGFRHSSYKRRASMKFRSGRRTYAKKTVRKYTSPRIKSRSKYSMGSTRKRLTFSSARKKSYRGAYSSSSKKKY